jgi:hypothetical protein
MEKGERVMKKKIAFAFTTALVFGATACWAAGSDTSGSDLYLTPSITYGSYLDSIERDYILIERANLSLIPDLTQGLTFHYEHVYLKKNPGFETISQNQFGLSGYKALHVKAARGYLGGRVDVQYLDSEDQLTDDTAIPYVAATYKTEDGDLYLDVGYAYSGYGNPDVNQYTATLGLSLIDGKIWSQSRFYAIDPNEKVQNQNRTFALEERLYYYAVPDKLTYSLYALVGERIYAYDPEI